MALLTIAWTRRGARSTPCAMGGRAEKLLEEGLRVTGLAVWLAIGSPSWVRLLDAPGEVGSGHPAAWSALFLAFALGFWGATWPRRPADAPRAGRCCSPSSLVALALAWLGMPHFEGALFALVAAQAPALMRVAPAMALDALQGAALFPIVLPTHGALGATQGRRRSTSCSRSSRASSVLYLRQRGDAGPRRAVTRPRDAPRDTVAPRRRRSKRRADPHRARGARRHRARPHRGEPPPSARGSRRGRGRADPGGAVDAVRSTLGEVRALVHTRPRGRDDGGPPDRCGARRCAWASASPWVHLAMPASLRVRSTSPRGPRLVPMHPGGHHQRAPAREREEPLDRRGVTTAPFFRHREGRRRGLGRASIRERPRGRPRAARRARGHAHRRLAPRRRVHAAVRPAREGVRP